MFGTNNQNVLRDQPASIIFNFFIFNCFCQVGATNQNVLRDQPASIIFSYFIFNCFCQPERRREWQEVQLSRLREGVEAVIERERV